MGSLGIPLVNPLLPSQTNPSGNPGNFRIHSTISRDSAQSVVVQEQLVLESLARRQSKLPRSQIVFDGLSLFSPPPDTEIGDHDLQDYQMQLMRLEEERKTRFLMAREEQDTITPPVNRSTAPKNGEGYTWEEPGVLGQKRLRSIEEHDQGGCESCASAPPGKRHQLSSVSRPPPPAGATLNKQEARDTKNLYGNLVGNPVGVAQTHALHSTDTPEAKVRTQHVYRPYRHIPHLLKHKSPHYA